MAAPIIVMAGPDRPSLPLDHHFCPFLTAQRSFSPAKPSFFAIFAGQTVVMADLIGHLSSWTIIFAPF